MEHWTGEDLMETLSLVSTQGEADNFMEAYGALWSEPDDAIESLRYWIQLVAYDPDDDDGEIERDCLRICVLLGIQLPSRDEVISPMQTWGDTSLGVKAAA